MKNKWIYFFVGVVVGVAIMVIYTQGRIIAELNAQLKDCGNRERSCGSQVEELSASNQHFRSETEFLNEEVRIMDDLLDEKHKVGEPKKHKEMGYLRDRSQDC